MAIEKVLVVDDDSLTRELLCEILSRHGCDVILAADGDQAVQAIERDELDLVLTDIKMPGLTGMDVLQRACEVNRDAPVILMTAFGTIENAVEAMKQGAFDYIVKPVSPDRVDLLFRRVTEWQALVRENRYLRSQVAGHEAADELVGRHPRLAEVIDTVRRVAQSKATVLIQGESGTGKELIARLAHYSSPRSDNAFITVNCAALSESLLESELFGHERGAFTGAIARREGRFELAHGGTLLLDEISEIPPPLQAKLLRAVEEEEFERVGGTRTIKVDVRLVCTTNRDLTREVAEGRFRDDLYYRLNVVPVVLAPLRERRDDIPLLATYFVRRFARENASPARRVTKEAMQLLKQAPWPGNVRELRNAIQRAVVLATSEEIGPDDLPADLSVVRPRRAGGGVMVGQSIDEMERELILRTLESTGWNKTEAARILDVTPRTLRNKLGRYRQDGQLDGHVLGSSRDPEHFARA